MPQRRRRDREQGRCTSHAWCIGSAADFSSLGAESQRTASARRISASAARPTSSCSSVGSRVPSTRWSSWPGPAQRARQRGVARGARTTRRPRRRRRSRRAGTAAPASGDGRSTARAQQRGAGQVGGQQRRHQVRAAAVVLLGRVARVAGALLVGADRLVLDAVVGGEVAAAQGDERRRERERGQRRLAAERRACAGAAPRRPSAAARHRAERRWRPGRAGAPRGSARLTSGMTAIASPRRTTPRTPGDRARRAPRSARLAARRRRAMRAVAGAHGRGPVRRARARAGRCAGPSRRGAACRARRRGHPQAAPWSTSR